MTALTTVETPDRVLVIDPGTVDCGSAYFQDRQLVMCGSHKGGKGEIFDRCTVIAREVKNRYAAWCPSKLVVEWPRKYDSDNVNPDVLMWLTYVLGEIRGQLAGPLEFTRVFPADWKGQVDKQIMSDRTWGALDVAERAAVGKLRKNHNTMDAIGIGLFFLNRG